MKASDVRILFLGASIMSGWRTTATRLWADVLEPARALNLGVPGETSGQLLWRLQQPSFLRGLQPRVVVLQIGANDVSVDAEGVAENIRDIVALVRRQLPEARIILWTILPTGAADSAVRAKNNATNARLHALEDGMHVVVRDASALFTDAAGNLLPAMLPDGLHPSEAGYAAWWRLLAPELGFPQTAAS